jgi:NADPH:quinone reductase-like Zn-dependent oxidoreductase
MAIKRIVKWSLGAILLALFLWLFIAYWTSTNDCNRAAATPNNPMKAIRYCEYGSPDVVVKLHVVEKPVPNDDQVLIKVRAASLNAFDVGVIRDSWLVRLFFGLRKPRDTRLGQDLAGVVEAVGKNVTQFKPGDEVFGTCRGGLAEYTCTRERALARKPPSVTFEQAASLPLAGSIALQGLREGKIQSGQKVLINGATGGVGTFAVQIAKSLGGEVTAVCSTRNVDLVKSIGADHVIDYTKEDFTKGDQLYDVIFDDVCNHSFSERSRVLTPKGICVLAGVGGAGVTSGQAIGRIASNLLIAGARSSFTDQKFPFPTLYRIKTSKDDLITLGELVASGKIKPVIERTYLLSDAPQAFSYLYEGHARGKLVVTIP